MSAPSSAARCACDAAQTVSLCRAVYISGRDQSAPSTSLTPSVQQPRVHIYTRGRACGKSQDESKARKARRRRRGRSESGCSSLARRLPQSRRHQRQTHARRATPLAVVHYYGRQARARRATLSAAADIARLPAKPTVGFAGDHVSVCDHARVRDHVIVRDHVQPGTS